MRLVIGSIVMATALLCLATVVCVVLLVNNTEELHASPAGNVSDGIASANASLAATLGRSLHLAPEPDAEELRGSRPVTEGTGPRERAGVELHGKKTLEAPRHNVDYSQEAILSRPGESLGPVSILPENSTILTSASLPDRKEYYPEVGNGHIATVVHSDAIFMNGLYNGPNTTSHRARMPSTAGYSVNWTSPPDLERMYSLDVGRGYFAESYIGAGATITLRTYAHRRLTLVMVSELTLSRENVSTEVSVRVDLNRGPPSDDVDLEQGPKGILHGRTKEAEYPELAPRTDFYLVTSASLEGVISLSPGLKSETFLALTSIDVNKENAVQQYEQGEEIVCDDPSRADFLDGTLLSGHVEEWNKIWQRGRIDVTGNVSIARLNYACLYYLLTSLPFTSNRDDWPFVGLSPGGLAHGSQDMDYMGHVFWDQDTWMFPPIALLHSDIGRTLVQTRTRTLEAAQLLAHRSGDEGAKYPWESAFTGLETCPAWPYGRYEIHVIGDVAMMLRQYWQLTRDAELMADMAGADVVWDTARYWASRSWYSGADDTYRILDVMPPDEFHYPVNDSVYTNSIAALTLHFANQLARELGKPENETWANISRRLRILYDAELDFHPEFEGFSIHDHRAKQADVVLLGFPLMVEMKESTRRNDLAIYEQITAAGPAMTWSMFLLGWLELANETRAAELYSKTVKNAQEPFLVWSEYADGDGATNFLTGMGGYLQLVLFGYAGCRIRDDLLTFDPVLITGSSELTLTGIDYRGGSLDLWYSEDDLRLTQTALTPGSAGLAVRLNGTGPWLQLVTGEPVSTRIQPFQIKSLK
ncbi:hypothetical protein Btru_034976 [Bulinus truncatus]|nr:hypothetical protein Btru_034976 [Bulinus truncatus]